MELSQIPIGKFSLITQISQRSLRYYDEKGILVPEFRDISGYRYYSLDQIQMAVKIRFLVSLGFNLNQIEQIFRASQLRDITSVKDIITKHRVATQIEIERLKKVEKILEEADKTLDILYQSSTNPIIKEVPKIRVISQRVRGPYSIVPQLVNKLMMEIAHRENQVQFVKVNGPVIYLCHEEEFKESDVDIEIAVPISGQITLHSEEIEVRNISGGWILSTLYTGPYEEIGDAYIRVHQYIIENQLRIRDTPMELYLNNPMQTPTNELLTEIQFPIEKPTPIEIKSLIDSSNKLTI